MVQPLGHVAAVPAVATPITRKFPATAPDGTDAVIVPGFVFALATLRFTNAIGAGVGVGVGLGVGVAVGVGVGVGVAVGVGVEVTVGVGVGELPLTVTLILGDVAKLVAPAHASTESVSAPGHIEEFHE